MPDEDTGQELLSVAIEALSEIWGLGGEPAAGIARAALDEIERVIEGGEQVPED
ncbi:MAG TPA: hypothetical protein VMI13_07210 [Solirubrobacteraceae bacterium]|nr:hypothetical protein [Solirubrobacteraceae bacterium]